MIFELFVAFLCLGGAWKAWTSEGQCKLFNKRDLPIRNLKKYNHTCAILIIGFGLVAEIFMLILPLLGDLGMMLMTIGIMLDALIMCVIYAKMERKYVREGL